MKHSPAKDDDIAERINFEAIRENEQGRRRKELEEMEQQEIYLCENTFRKYKKAAIKVIGEILWGYEDRESVGILKQFAVKNYGEEWNWSATTLAFRMQNTL